MLSLFIILSEALFQKCGYLAAFLGTLLEGEVSLITTVIAAKMGYFNYYIAMLFAFAGAWIADFFKYFIGKTKGRELLVKKPKLQKRFDKYTKKFEKHPLLLLSFYKFFFGATTIILIMAGIKNIPIWKFILHSIIAVLLWVVTLGSLGYFCADILLSHINWAAENKLTIIGTLVSFILLYWIIVKRPYLKYCLSCK